MNALAEPIAYAKHDDVLARIIMQLPHYTRFEGTVSPISLCFLGNTELKKYAEELNQKHRIYKNIIEAAEDDLSPCNYLYVGSKSAARRLLNNHHSHPLVVISNYSTFIDEGGAIAAVDNDGQIQIYLNLTAAKELHLYLSPDLIELSKRVIQ